MDRRLTASNGRVAAAHLDGIVRADTFTEGKWMKVGQPIVPLLRAPDGAMDLQMVFGQAFCVLEVRDGFAFGYTQHDGYCGYLDARQLMELQEATHIVAIPRTYGKATPELKKYETIVPFYFGARVRVLADKDGWSEVATSGGKSLWLPSRHIRPNDWRAPDLAAVAEAFLHAPYLWGGNTVAGIDCSALVQVAMLASGTACPRDSDMQEAALGGDLGPDADLKRGDLIFWKGHVGMMVDDQILIHANAFHMAVAVEPLSEAAARIEVAGDGPVTMRKRL